jgi:hypothetical protein
LGPLFTIVIGAILILVAVHLPRKAAEAAHGRQSP